jgi:hypothetical protein
MHSTTDRRWHIANRVCRRTVWERQPFVLPLDNPAELYAAYCFRGLRRFDVAVRAGCSQPIKWDELRCTAPRKTSSFSSTSAYTRRRMSAAAEVLLGFWRQDPSILEAAWWRRLFLLVSRLSIRTFDRIVEDSRVCRLWYSQSRCVADLFVVSREFLLNVGLKMKGEG